VAFCKRAEEVLACTGDHAAAYSGFTHCDWRRQCGGSIYIHFILMMMNRAKGEVNASETITVLVTGLVVVFLVLGSRHPGLLFAAAAVGVAAIASRRLAGVIADLWMGLARMLGKVVPVILLAMLFYCILTPLAWLRRLFDRNDPLRLNDPGDTLFVDHTREIDNGYFEKMW